MIRYHIYLGLFIAFFLGGFLAFVILGNIIARMYGVDTGIVTGLGVIVVSWIASLTCFFKAIEDITK